MGFLDQIAVSDGVFEIAPDYVLGLLVVDELRNTGDALDVALVLDAAEDAVRAGTARGEPSLDAWRDVYRALGVNPKRYPCAADSIRRRVARQGSLPRLSPAVDACNAVSLATGLPVAVCDVSRLPDGGLSVVRAEGAEIFTPLGGAADEVVNPGEVVYRDDTKRAHSRRWNWRQSDDLRTEASSEHVLVTVESAVLDAGAEVADAVRRVSSLFATLASTVTSVAPVTRSDPSRALAWPSGPGTP